MKKIALMAASLLIIFGFIFPVANAVNLQIPFSVTQHVGLGSKGSSVMALQNFLVHKGYLSGAIDGKFGPKTKAAVVAYQKANKIPSTGFVGSLTLASVNKGINLWNQETNPTTNTGTNTSQKLSIKNTSPLPSATVGVEYSIDIEGVGGTAGYNWELVNGALPAGITLTKTAIRCIMAPCYNWMPARISGTPEAAGMYNFVIEVMSGDEKVQKSFSLEILNNTSASSSGSSAGNTGVVCEYARPPLGYHYENMKTYPPCGATLVAD